MNHYESGPRGAGNAGTALKIDYREHSTAGAESDPADARLRRESEHVARRQRRRVEADLTELQREVRADDNLARETWSSRSAHVIRQDQLAGRVTRADFLRLARVVAHLAAQPGLRPAEVVPW